MWLRGREQLAHEPLFRRSLLIIGALCVLAAFFTEVVPVLAVAKLQLFKLTVWAKVLFLIAVAGAGATIMPRNLHRWTDRLTRNSTGTVIAAFALVALVLVGILPGGPFYRRVEPFRSASSDLTKVEGWAKENAPIDAVFAVPPSNSTFRSRAQRAIIVNFKSFPFRDDQMHSWLQRLSLVAPAPLPKRGGAPHLALLDSAYSSLSPAYWKAVSDSVDIDFVVRERPFPAAPFPLTVAFQTPTWMVYRVSTP